MQDTSSAGGGTRNVEGGIIEVHTWCCYSDVMITSKTSSSRYWNESTMVEILLFGPSRLWAICT
jgi:hypothetical protein